MKENRDEAWSVTVPEPWKACGMLTGHTCIHYIYFILLLYFFFHLIIEVKGWI